MAETKDWHLKMREPLQKEEIFPSKNQLFSGCSANFSGVYPENWFDCSKIVEGWCFPPRLMPGV